MSTHTFFVSQSAVRNLKKSAQQLVTDVPSSHLSEAIAASLGFKTQAALRSALDGRATTEALKPCNIRLIQRLHQLGHTSVPNDLRLLPELNHSYTPFKRLPLRKSRGVRWYAWRNVIVSAINAGLDQRVFGLSPGENWWHGNGPETHESKPGIYHFKLNEGMTAVASVKAINGDELSISVILNPRKSDVQPEWYCGFADGDSIAHCWLERRLGAWVQDGGEAFRCRRLIQASLAEMVIEPKGYADQGSFFM